VNRSVVATVLLLVPLALTLPSTIRHEHARARDVPALQPPVHWPHDANVPLLAAMRARIPEDATIAFEGDRPLYLESGWVRWVAFVLAPRRVVTGEDGDWLVVVGGERPDVGRHVRRYGRDWLVER
jgi:hypothetical protein